jgi:hypothetical protein
MLLVACGKGRRVRVPQLTALLAPFKYSHVWGLAACRPACWGWLGYAQLHHQRCPPSAPPTPAPRLQVRTLANLAELTVRLLESRAGLARLLREEQLLRDTFSLLRWGMGRGRAGARPVGLDSRLLAAMCSGWLCCRCMMRWCLCYSAATNASSLHPTC